jgi:hypothetical protein
MHSAHADLAIKTALDLILDRDTVSAPVQYRNRQKNELLEFAEVILFHNDN